MDAAPFTVTVQLLGRFAVTVADRPVGDAPPWGSRKAQHLVKLLALAPGHRLPIDHLLDTLWPDLDPAAARRAYYQALYLARRALDPEHRGILASRHQAAILAAPGGVIVDLDRLRAAAAEARRLGTVAACEAALALHTGELLPDDRYEDWAIVAREEAHRLHAGLLRDLARLHEAGGAWDAACAVLERLVAHDPASEEAHVALMRAHAGAGRRQRALAQFRQLREALRRELDAEPEPASQRLYAMILAHHSADDEQSPVSPAPAPRHNLPVPTTTLFGRAAAITAVGEALREARLVTLAGTGGCGKTRLGIAVAHSLADRYRDCVWWVDLAPLAEGSLVPGTIARILGLRELDTAAIVAALRAQRALLVLDNCEHLLAACAPLADTLLANCPGLRILATSREALRVAGEAVWRVPSLPVPDAVPAGGGAGALAALGANPAVQLFVARARHAQHAFALAPENMAAVATICRRLDGLPLALELAAARMAVLAPQQLADRLDDALGVLGGGPRTAPPRHRTLRATLDWSYRSLDEEERALLARLAVFAGGFTLAAAEEICGPGAGALDVLARLVDRSLVQVEIGAEGGRFRMLETIHQFARERLAATQDELACRERHAAFFRALAERVPAAPLPQLEAESQNLRAALGWWADHDPASGLAMALALQPFWHSADRLREGLAWLTARFLPAGAALPGRPRAQGLLLAGRLAFFLGDAARTRALAGEALTLASDRDLPLERAGAHLLLGWWARAAGDLAQAAGHYRAAGAAGAGGQAGRRASYASRTELANLALDRRDWASGVAQYRAIIALARHEPDTENATTSPAMRTSAWPTA